MVDDDPTDRLESSLDELDETGALDSERIEFRTTKIANVSPDELPNIVSRLDDSYRVDVRIEIVDTDPDPGEAGVTVEFDYPE